MSNPKLILNPEYSLYEKAGEVFCDSLQIAETFSKEHYNVIRDIENLDCSSNFTDLNFECSKYKDNSGKSNKKYLMTKDGFTFLVMGYTGKQAREIEVIEDYTGMIVEEVEGGRLVFPNQESRDSLAANIWGWMDKIQGEQYGLEITTTLRRRTPEELAAYKEEQRLFNEAEGKKTESTKTKRRSKKDEYNR